MATGRRGSCSARRLLFSFVGYQTQISTRPSPDRGLWITQLVLFFFTMWQIRLRAIVLFWTCITPQQLGKFVDLFSYSFSPEAYRVKLKKITIIFRLWWRNVPELIQTKNMFYFHLQFLYSFPEVNLVFKLWFLLCSYLESINDIVSPLSFAARVLFYKDMPPGTLRNYAGTRAII